MKSKSVKVYQSYEMDVDLDNELNELVLLAEFKNMYFYRRHKLDLDIEEAKELARSENKSKVLIHEDDSMPCSPVKTDAELFKMKNDSLIYINNNMGKITVDEFLRKYHKIFAEFRFEKLRQISGIPSIIIINERKKVQKWDSKEPIQHLSKYGNLVVNSFIIKKGKKGKEYMEMKLKDGRTLFQFQGKWKDLFLKLENE